MYSFIFQAVKTTLSLRLFKPISYKIIAQTKGTKSII